MKPLFCLLFFGLGFACYLLVGEVKKKELALEQAMQQQAQLAAQNSKLAAVFGLWQAEHTAAAATSTAKKALLATAARKSPELTAFLAMPLPSALHAGGGVLGATTPIAPHPPSAFAANPLP